MGTGYVASVREPLLGLVGLHVQCVGGEGLNAQVYECAYNSAMCMCV